LTTTRKLKIAGVIALVSAIVIVVLQNQDTVSARVLLFDIEMPMAALLFVMLAVGFLLGILVTARMNAKDRKRSMTAAAPRGTRKAPPSNTP